MSSPWDIVSMCIIEMEAYGTITSSTTSTSSSSSVTIVAYERQMKEMAIRVAAGMTHTIDDMYCCSFYFISYCCWVLFGHPPPLFPSLPSHITDTLPSQPLLSFGEAMAQHVVRWREHRKVDSNTEMTSFSLLSIYMSVCRMVFFLLFHRVMRKQMIQLL
jgi:hypothetical protein